MNGPLASRHHWPWNTRPSAISASGASAVSTIASAATVSVIGKSQRFIAPGGA